MKGKGEKERYTYLNAQFQTKAMEDKKGFLIATCYSLDLHSDAYVFPFLLCFSLLFFSQLFVRPPHTAILLFCISFPWGWS